MDTEAAPATHTAMEDYWRAVHDVIEWADGQLLVIQPPLAPPPPEYRTAA